VFSRGNVEVEKEGVAVDRGVVRFTGRVLSGSGAAREAEGELALLARFPCRGRLRLDFDGVELASAAILGRLVALHQSVRDAGGQLVLENVGPPLSEVFRATGLVRVLDVRSTT
jgi:anti-anti-sigma factor